MQGQPMQGQPMPQQAGMTQPAQAGQGQPVKAQAAKAPAKDGEKKKPMKASSPGGVLGQVFISVIGLVVLYYVMVIVFPAANFLGLDLPGVQTEEPQPEDPQAHISPWPTIPAQKMVVGSWEATGLRV